MKNFLANENGQGMVEYGLIIALIAVVVIGALALLGPKVKDIFSKAGDAIDNPSKYADKTTNSTNTNPPEIQ